MGLIQLSDVQAEEVEFLWFPRIPLGKLTMIDGDPGIGKSWLTAALATSISRGSSLPEANGHLSSGNVLMLSAEDGLEDTIKPRLDAMDADCSRIFSPADPLVFDRKGIVKLEKFILEIQPKIVLIDPIVAYMGGSMNMNQANQTREFLRPLAALAHKYKCAVVTIRHLSKDTRKSALYRGQGSIDLSAACRSVLFVGVDRQDEEIRGIIHIKSNLARKALPIGYTIEQGQFRWLNEVSMTVDDLIDDREMETSPIQEARDFISQFLTEGPIEAKKMLNEAKKAGIAHRTLMRAKAELNISSKRTGEGWLWHWPI